jgi:hypothetical protein
MVPKKCRSRAGELVAFAVTEAPRFGGGRIVDGATALLLVFAQENRAIGNAIVIPSTHCLGLSRAGFLV